MKRALLVLPLLAACSRDYVEGSDFSFSDEEWTLQSEFEGPTLSIIEAAQNGTAPYICGTDTGFSGGRFWRFRAPNKYLGNASRAFGNKLTWEMMTEIPPGKRLITSNDIFLKGRSETLVVNVPNGDRENRVWAQFFVYLDDRSEWVRESDGSRVSNDDIKSVLRNLLDLVLPGEQLDGEETTCIDNVYFGTP